MLTLLLAAALAADPQVPTPVPPPSAPAAPVVTLAEAASQAGARAGGAERGRPIRFVWRNHPSLRFGNKLRLDFLGKFQWDARHPGDDPADFDTTELHRA